MGMPPMDICNRKLKRKNDSICEIKYREKLNCETMKAKNMLNKKALKKRRVRELRQICTELKIDYKQFNEKSEFLKAILNSCGANKEL